MRKIFVLPILMLTSVAGASTTFYYDAGYDGTNGCSGWFLTPDAKSCSEAVTRIKPQTVAGRTFGGYWANGSQVINSDGQIVIDTRAAPTLFDNTDPDTVQRKHAEGAYTAPDTILVQTRHFWKDMAQDWYVCTATGFHLCNKNGDYIAPPSMHCWTTERWPCDENGQNCNYDYLFNSYLMADGKTFAKPSTFYSPSNPNGWQNPYPSQVATGDGVLASGCNMYYLDYDEDQRSMHKVQAFACKMIKNGLTWTNSLYIDSRHGTFKLDNGTLGECKYELVCDEGYTLSESGISHMECRGIECKGFFDGLITKYLTATCEKDS